MMHQCSVVTSTLLLIGRVLFSLMFITAGFDKLMHFSTYAADMSGKGIEAATLVLIIAIIFELGGGLLVLLGWYTRIGAVLLFLFIIPVTYVYHNFWAMGGQEMVNNSHHFFKNLSLLGGTLYLIACGAGHISIDGFIRKKCCQNYNNVKTPPPPM